MEEGAGKGTGAGTGAAVAVVEIVRELGDGIVFDD